MSNSVHVQSIAALEDLKAGLQRFSAHAEESLAAATRDIARMEDWLAERVRFWQSEERRCRAAVQQAAYALQVCQSRVYYDPQTGRSYRPNCDQEMYALRAAQRRLAEVEESLRVAMRYQRVFADAVLTFRTEAQRLHQWDSVEMTRATAFLERKLNSLRAYAGVGVGFAGGVGGLATGLGASQAVESMSSPSSGISNSPRQGASPFAAVPIAEIDLSDSYVHSPDDFHKISHAEMVAGIRTLEAVVRPAVEQGKDADYFSDLDAQQGLSDSQGYRRIYDAFYGQDAITLERAGNGYQVLNGFHRLYIARELGITSLPARVI